MYNRDHPPHTRHVANVMRVDYHSRMLRRGPLRLDQPNRAICARPCAQRLHGLILLRLNQITDFIICRHNLGVRFAELI